MKIELNDWQDVRDLVRMMNPVLLREWHPALGSAVEIKPVSVEATGAAGGLAELISKEVVRMATGNAEPDGLSTDIAQPEITSDAEVEARISEHAAPVGTATADLDGVAHHTDWHSTPAKINADGRWKARRGRDNDEYKAWVALWSMNGAEAAVAADAEPVATETHALPQDELPDDSGPIEQRSGHPMDTGELPQEDAAPTVDLFALVEASRVLADGYSADFKETLETAKVFSAKYGHAKFNELKSAVAPIDGNPFGKALQLFGPEERQLMRACIDNYPKGE